MVQEDYNNLVTIKTEKTDVGDFSTFFMMPSTPEEAQQQQQERQRQRQQQQQQAAAAAAFQQQLLLSPLTQALFFPFMSPTYSFGPPLSQSAPQQMPQQPAASVSPDSAGSGYSASPNPSSSGETGRPSSSNSNGRQRRPAPTLATGRRNLKSEPVSPEEERRRAARREKNRRAAAKCRQKRQDCISTLEEEMNQLEEERTATEEQIEKLRREADELQTILQRHANNCRVTGGLALPPPPPLIAPPNQSLACHQSPPRSQRPANLSILPTASSTMDTPGLTTPSTFSTSCLPPVTASWETGGLGLTPLLGGLDTPKEEPFPELVDIKTESDYVTL